MARSPRKILHVSTHAVYRWLDRSGLIDVEYFRASLATALDRAFQAGAAMSRSEFLILSDGLVYVIRNDTLVTVMPDEGRHGAVLKAQAGNHANGLAGDNVG